MLGSLGFLSPWSLAALIALPVIWWLLRTTPPRPQSVQFPPTRLLKGLKNRNKTPSRSPWWLTLIRMLAAACLIFALAEPVLNPEKKQSLTKGPLVLIIDNGWASANGWNIRKDFANLTIDQAEALSKPVLVLTTAGRALKTPPKLGTPKAAREFIEALPPSPIEPNRADALSIYQKFAANHPDLKSASIYWLSDGLDYGQAEKFAEQLRQTLDTDGQITMVNTASSGGPLALTSKLGPGGRLDAIVLRADQGPRSGKISAHSKNGQKLAEVDFSFANSGASATVTLDMPSELRNQITSIEITGQNSAGAVHLLDARSRWNRVGLLASTSQEKSQPLLAPLYYINRALTPYATLLRTKEKNFQLGLADLMKQNPSVLIMADIGNINGASLKNLHQWTSRGGVLIRFAGPRLEKASDDLLPAPLRLGGRTLGGALSWSSPQPLAPFDEQSLFEGLAGSPEVTVSRQVLADPAMLNTTTQVWARLKDGTPLVTARKQDNGWLILFHITANSDWSNLPLSGLFVDMLRRLNTLSSITSVGAGSKSAGQQIGDKAKFSGSGKIEDANPSADFKTPTQNLLPPYRILNGFGELTSPQPTTRAISMRDFSNHRPSINHPPGLYGKVDGARALNLITPKTKLVMLKPDMSGIKAEIFETEKPVLLKAHALLAALSLLFLDILAVLFLQSGLKLKSAKSVSASALLLCAIAISSTVLALSINPANAQKSGDDLSRATNAALNTHLAYVMTGDTEIDRTSRLGLTGLSRYLARRTAVEPTSPMGVDIDHDELAFFPLLYWPVIDSPKTLSETTLAKIDAYMKQGGMIIFDTRDFQSRVQTLNGTPGGNSDALNRLIGKLDIPRLQPVPENHVLTKSFYLLSSFPGRWNGGELWVEARQNSVDATGDASQTDGVSSILITSNDLAAAWALDDNGTPLYAVVPGGERQREWAFRTGVNIVMYALTGNYKADQVHVPALLERLGQ